jgi:DNA polymerase (family 10)
MAKIIREIGELLELKGETYFKVLAYARAADTIEHLDLELEDLDFDDPKVKIKNIGESIFATIKELVRTGESRKHTQLKAEFPEGFLSLLEVPGVGPKTAKALLDQRNVKNISDLAMVARAGQIKDLPGFGEKTEQNILRGIEQYLKHQERMTLPKADAIAARIVENLNSSLVVDMISVAGSLRRMKDTVGDIDILVSSKEPDSVMDVFCKDAYEVISKGDTKSSIMTAEGVQADLRVVGSNQYGSALLYFTGSKEHNIQLREIAVMMSLKLNEYGLFNKEEKNIASRTEQDIYKALGMDFIDPLMREGRGEIALAVEGELPNLVQLSDIKGDFHVHSEYSDGGNNILDIIKAAKGRGYKFIGITDHARNLRIASGLSMDDIKRQHFEIDKIMSNENDLTILKGAELNIDLNGDLDFDDRFLENFDYVISSIHSAFSRSREEQTQRMLRAMEHPKVKIIGHPTGRILNKREPYDIDLDSVYQKAFETSTALEINAYPDRLDLSDMEIFKARKYGVKFAINTDSHKVSHLGLMRYGVATAARGWLEKGHILNCMDIVSLKRYLKG